MVRKKKKRVLRVGVTGGIGGGKSAVCRIFRELGVPVLSADEIARELTKTVPEIKRKIQNQFGSGVFSKNGEVDRKKLAELAFSDREKKKKLNEIIHPFVLRKMDEEFRRLEKVTETPFVVQEAALIYEAKADRNLDYVIVVDAEEEKRIEWVMKRDQVSRQDVLRRINSQMSTERKKKLADFVVLNDGDLKSLEEKVRFLYSLLLKIGESRSL